MKSYIAEFVGTALLLAIVAGSGIMGDTLAGGNAAVALLGNLGVKVKVKGIGKVKRQSIPAGGSISKNTLILLELS